MGDEQQERIESLERQLQESLASKREMAFERNHLDD